MNHFIVKVLVLILIFTTLTTFSLKWEGNKLLDKISLMETIEQSSLVARQELVCPPGTGSCPNNRCCPLNLVCVPGGCCPRGFGRCIDGSRRCCPLAPTTKAPPTTKALPKGPGGSPVWKGLNPYRGKTKTNGKGRNQKFYEWDYTHNDIEVYDRNGNHLGSMDPISGDMIKPPVKGRKINI
jgi:hypothetical protein